VAGYPIRGYDWTYRATLPNAFPLVAGAAVAARIGLARCARWSLPGVLGVAMLVGLVIAPIEPSDDWMILRTLLTVVAALLLLVRSPGWMTVAPLRYCGRVSYGWYLWHVPLQFLLGGITGSVVSLGVAAVSWHLWERRWLRPGPVAGPDRRAVAPATQDASLDPSAYTRP
jgi:peptidoglycan/LPS O-acetylase OafA/YrhL